MKAINNIIDKITYNIKNKKEQSPFLFLWSNNEILDAKVFEISEALLKEFWIPKSYIYKIEDNNEKIKIQEIKEFLEPSNSKTQFDFQIFIIENIWRLTLKSSNRLLKFLEEPGLQNIVFLTNSNQSNILNTILSRVQIINLSLNNLPKENEFYQSLLYDYFFKDKKWKINIFSYFYKNNLEKTDYISFLENTVLFFRKNNQLKPPKIFNELDLDISSIQNNNVNAKYIVDKFLINLSNI